MRVVQSCDFCGGDAAGTFEVVPDELLSSDGDQRRVALCEHCRTTLEGVLEPFLEPFLDRGETAVDDDARTRGEAGSGAEAAATATPSDGGLEQTPPSAAVDADARAEGIAIGRADETARSDGEQTATGERGDDSPTEADDGDEKVSDPGGDGDEGVPDPGGEPDQFRKVMRLLSNREFPVDRAAFAELTAGAYDLEDDHVARIIDHAVERGVVVDDAGTLRKS